MVNRSPFRIGDAVTVHTSRNGAQSLLTVKAFESEDRCMVLSDDSEWRPDGKRLFRAGGAWYRGPWVERTTEADVAHVARRRAVGVIRKFADQLHMESAVPTDALLRIMDVIAALPPEPETETEAETGLDDERPGKTKRPPPGRRP